MLSNAVLRSFLFKNTKFRTHTKQHLKLEFYLILSDYREKDKTTWTEWKFMFIQFKPLYTSAWMKFTIFKKILFYCSRITHNEAARNERRSFVQLVCLVIHDKLHATRGTDN